MSSEPKADLVLCRACDAGLPLTWSVQCKKTMHLAQGLSLTSCKRVDALEQQARKVLGPKKKAP